MQPPDPIATDILLLGAGAAHLEVLRRFARRKRPGIRLTLVAPAPWTPGAGMLSGLISGDRTAADACIDLEPLATAAGARLVLAEATGLDLAGRKLSLAGRPPLPFDLLSVDLHGESALPSPRGSCVPISPPARFLDRLPAIEATLPDGARLAIIGGSPIGIHAASAGIDAAGTALPRRGGTTGPLPAAGPKSVAAAGATHATAAGAPGSITGDADRANIAGRTRRTPAGPISGITAAPSGSTTADPRTRDAVTVELALALARRMRGRLHLVLVTEAPEPLASAPPLARRTARAALVEAGVELVSAVRAGALAEGRLALSDGSFLPADLALWAGDTVAPGFLAAAGLACDAAGRLRVNAGQRSVSHYGIFAAGDCAARPRQHAAGPLLFVNLCRAARGRALRRSLRQWLSPRLAPGMLDLGGGRAVAWTDRLAVSGEAVGRWLDWLRRRRIRAFQPDVAPAHSRPPRHTGPARGFRRLQGLRWPGLRNPARLSENLTTPHQAEHPGEFGLLEPGQDRVSERANSLSSGRLASMAEVCGHGPGG